MPALLSEPPDPRMKGTGQDCSLRWAMNSPLNHSGRPGSSHKKLAPSTGNLRWKWGDGGAVGPPREGRPDMAVTWLTGLPWEPSQSEPITGAKLKLKT